MSLPPFDGYPERDPYRKKTLWRYRNRRKPSYAPRAVDPIRGSTITNERRSYVMVEDTWGRIHRVYDGTTFTDPGYGGRIVGYGMITVSTAHSTNWGF